jgi:hypothetical protein
LTWTWRLLTDSTIPEQEASRKLGRLSPIIMTTTPNLIRFQNGLKDIKGEYEFQNEQNGMKCMEWNCYHKRKDRLFSHEILPGEKYSPLFFLPQILKSLSKQ